MWIHDLSVILSICFSSFAYHNVHSIVKLSIFIEITFESKNRACI